MGKDSTHKLVDTREIQELNKSFNSYKELIYYYQNLDSTIFDKNQVYTENHHILPKSEGGDDSINNLVRLDYLHHIMAHFLRASEYKEKDKKIAYKNFLAVSMMCSFKKRALSEKENDLFKNALQSIDWVIESKQAWIDLQTELYKKLDFVWVTDGKSSFKLPNEIAHYVINNNPNLYRGRVFRNPEGKIWITNGFEKKYLLESEALNFIQKNPEWHKGMGILKKKVFNNPTGTMPPTTLGKKWVHKKENNNIIRKNIFPNEIDAYIKNGWTLGSGNKHTNLNKVSIHKENHIKNIEKNYLDNYLKDGWQLGRTDDYKQNCSKAKFDYWKKKKSHIETS